MLTIAHLSDPHLDLSDRRRERLLAVLRELAQLPQLDALVISGDLADHGLPDEYGEFFAALPAGIPALVCAGNHDLTDPLREALVRRGLPDQLNSTLPLEGLSIVAIDTHIDGRDDGTLSPESLAYLASELESADGPVAVMMHHPPVAVGHDVVDEHYALRNPEDLERIIRAHPAVIAVFTGHVHAAFTAAFAGVPVLGAPGIVSTMRLGSRTNPIADPDSLPGFALHTVIGSQLRTIFHTLSPSVGEARPRG